MHSLTARRGLVAVIQVLALMASLTTAWSAVLPPQLPEALRAIPPSELVECFSLSFEVPNSAAEVARHRAWAPPTADETSICPALVAVMRKYPNTSDARRSLLDITQIYARKGDWETAEAPFRYVMEIARGKTEARVAQVKLVELHRYAGTPAGASILEECRAAVSASEGFPEEGLGRMLLADLLVEHGEFDEALSEYQRVIDLFPSQPYSSYARIRYSFALVGRKQPARAREVLEPVLQDPIWRGRAYWARGKAYAAEGQKEAAIADYRIATQTADSSWVRAEAYLALARLYSEMEQPDQAVDCLLACLTLSPDQAKRLEVRIDLARALLSARRFVEAAEYTVSIETDLLNGGERYAKTASEEALAECDKILASCDAKLSSGKRSER